MDSSNQWGILFLVTIGLCCVFGENCGETAIVQMCTDELMNYETSTFPFYGENDAKLEDTCGNINASFECVDSYIQKCNGAPDCDEDCQEYMKVGPIFLQFTGLPGLAEELCNKESIVREVYLINYQCLKKNSELYSKCHNISEESQNYLNTVQGVEAIHKRCCYFSWFRSCFTDITEENCGKNATLFVDFGWQKLVGHVSAELCKDFTGSCDGDNPPLPPKKEIQPEDSGHKEDKDQPGESEETTHDKSENYASWKKSCTAIIIALGIISYLNIVLYK